jgi:hypothetical protein
VFLLNAKMKTMQAMLNYGLLSLVLILTELSERKKLNEHLGVSKTEAKEIREAKTEEA